MNLPRRGQLPLPETWDLIVVGSGIAALTYTLGVMQRHPGLRVLIFEQHDRPGGYASEFLRPKVATRFDCSLHKLSGMGENGNLKHALQELNIDHEFTYRHTRHLAEMCYLDAADTSDTSSIFHFPLSIQAKEAIRQLSVRFPNEQEGIEQFFEEVEKYGYAIYMQHLAAEYDIDLQALRYAKRNFDNLSVEQALKERIIDPTLRELLAIPALYVGAFPEQLQYSYFLHLAYSCFYSGCAYIQGGAQYLSQTLVRRIESLGGILALLTRVEQIGLPEDPSQHIRIETQRGCFSASQVILGADPLYVKTHLLQGHPVEEQTSGLPKKASPLNIANATTTLYISLDRAPDSLGLKNSETIILALCPDQAAELRRSALQNPSNQDIAERAYWQSSSMEITNYHLLDDNGGYAVVLNVLDSIEHWPVRKSSDYRSKKARASEVLLQRLYKAFPELEGHIQYTELSTPHTYQRYTNNSLGSGYGVLASPNAGKMRDYLPNIPKLHFMSAWVAGSGYEACIGYALQRSKHFSPSPTLTGC